MRRSGQKIILPTLTYTDDDGQQKRIEAGEYEVATLTWSGWKGELTPRPVMFGLLGNDGTEHFISPDTIEQWKRHGFNFLETLI